MVRCPSGSSATGITADASSEYLNRFQLRCSDGSATSQVGEFKDSISTISHDCAAGSSLVRFDHTSSSIVQSANSFCASNQDLINNVASPALDERGLGGSVLGTPSVRACPTGMAIVGAVGRAGARIDQVRWLCEDVNGTTLPNPHFVGLRGAANGRAKIELCSGHGAVRALWGHAGAEVDQLSAECFPTRVSASGQVELLEGNTRRHGLDFNGGTGGIIFNLPCPAGQAVVGLHVRSGGRLDAVGAVCAVPSSWGSGNTATTNTAMTSGTTGQESTLLCPSREFVVGLQSWAANTPEQNNITTIHGVQPLCRRLN